MLVNLKKIERKLSLAIAVTAGEKPTCPAAGNCKPKAHKLARTSAAMGVLAGIPGVRWAVVAGTESSTSVLGWKGVAGSSKVKDFK